MKSRWIIGSSDYLDLAFHGWKQARQDEAVIKIDVPQDEKHEFDFRILDELNPSDGAMFVAFDERLGNFKRTELMQAALQRGFKLEPFIHASAAIGSDTVIGLNAFVGANAVVGHGCRIDYNTVIHAGAHLGPACRVKSSCWIENGVQIGAGVEIGGNSILRTGAIVRDGVKVGRSCELGWPRAYCEDVPAKTYFNACYDSPIHTYGT
ncbi:UDP-3-O-(3-hydroxymyristoyl)glucosamine N-acyltransferase [Xanthomonas vesicatoria]|uniref:UDP-3-O-(3-hydroxymyristoyl)glucosamine N-acyltransferase n=1 Tax=Xanthomonas vesicatoria TaxID=56460 RepID=UPI0007320E6F|nr:UDP-3-O-(3-hydroxymyristoyl)glucosamine N-acyltransferase [Xanthomonas vesicatoria]KTF37376.1 UDP-3-O-(3-hydroxymyristoyl) glucosamine N-acyltransferase [Xanthomonas vesicatoria]MCC8559805.1 UDP-3-O-(3-hydroxymyristoyl)glucosamine N-acyltransferase [Xanthomonas vesicatoria]MCC8602944.1 UDP-3-O-(3-hydroxymyristoyl)glucosamine N-acyltransferase [Xanthomonas vesicatoria]MCC8611308.1 UDP-3-O-(3-hydroxymyristoyl)glucosamine N-acyltransferase [Xanthomonas vesicatoria]MCC8620352.1 UDP-3-O-(3-hydro